MGFIAAVKIYIKIISWERKGNCMIKNEVTALNLFINIFLRPARRIYESLKSRGRAGVEMIEMLNIYPCFQVNKSIARYCSGWRSWRRARSHMKTNCGTNRASCSIPVPGKLGSGQPSLYYLPCLYKSIGIIFYVCSGIKTRPRSMNSLSKLVHFRLK